MITHNSNNCKCFSLKSVENIKKDINLLYNFSDILEIQSINELENSEDLYDILYLIKYYESFIKANQFNDLKCPLCKRENVLHYHKYYTRDIIFHIGVYEVIAKINIAVLDCHNCKNNKGIQHFHALLPDFIFPYHIYESNIILSSLYDHLIKKIKLQTIIEQNKISHQLFYKWLKGLKKYCISASTILDINANIDEVINQIKIKTNFFLNDFFKQYYHPFFLFKLTCVPLVIMP